MKPFENCTIQNPIVEELRYKLHTLVELYGFNHSEVIECSHELDQIIIKIQRRSNHQHD